MSKGKLRVTNGKYGRDRDLFIPELTSILLDQWKKVKPENTKYFFTTLKGNKLIDRYIQNMVIRYGKKANIGKKISPHTLRHTYATEYYRQSKDIETLRKILGHSDISTTTIYITLANIDVENGMKEFKEIV